MKFLDVVYWIYKCRNPIRFAEKNSNLENYFKESRIDVNLPLDLTITAQVTLSAVGDLINHPYLKNSKNTLYSEIAPYIFDVDISMANLECVISEKVHGSFKFSSKSGPPLFYSKDEFDVIKGTKKKHFSFFLENL